MDRTIQPQVAYLLTLVALCLLALSSHQKAFAQNINCESGTLPNSCTFLPVLIGVAAPEAPPAQFDAVPVDSTPVDKPPPEHGDLNLALRGYQAFTTTLSLVDINGPVDNDAPQLAGLFAEPRLPTFVTTYQVNDWDWACEENGCRGAPIGSPEATLLGVGVTPGEAIHIPSREPEIYVGGYKTLVLYAEAERITLVYTRQDTSAFGYVVHLEDVKVDASLLSLYQQLDAADRSQLPALRNGERLGNAIGTTIKVAIRDTTSFMDPRSRKDWWVGY